MQQNNFTLNTFFFLLNSQVVGSSSTNTSIASNIKFPDPSTSDGLVNLDKYLADRSYIVGVEPSQADVEMFQKISEKSVKKCENISRWFNHIKSFVGEFKSLKEVDVSGSSPNSGTSLGKVDEC